MGSLDSQVYSRKRYLENGYDLDLTYITDKIIVIGNPYNNDSLSELRKFLTTRHAGQHRIYNLASEEEFGLDQDLDNVENFPFPSNNPCALKVIIKFCSIVDVYLNLKPENVVVLHCKTGKGRSCLLAACYLLHSGKYTNADEAVAFVCRQRTPIKLNALTVPSQIRYLYYYETLLKTSKIQVSTFRITHVRMNTIPAFNASIVHSGCTPHLCISTLAKIQSSEPTSDSHNVLWYPKIVYNQMNVETKRKLHRYTCDGDEYADFDLSDQDVCVRGDVVLSLFSKEEKMSQICFHTAFIESNYLCFDQSSIDLASKDKLNYTFDPNFKIELFVQRVTHPDSESLNIIDLDEIDAYSTSGSATTGSYGGGSRYVEYLMKYGNLSMEESDEDNPVL